MLFEMEQLQDGVWINVGFGNFTSLEDAMSDTAEFSENMEIPLDCLRVKPMDRMPKEELVQCICGGYLQFTADCRTICETCFKVTEIGENK